MNIGVGMDGGVPRIGSHVWIGPGAKLYSGITIADECAIGASAVVNKDFLQKHSTIASVPARIVSKVGNQYIGK